MWEGRGMGDIIFLLLFFVFDFNGGSVWLQVFRSVPLSVGGRDDRGTSPRAPASGGTLPPSPQAPLTKGLSGGQC